MKLKATSSKYIYFFSVHYIRLQIKNREKNSNQTWKGIIPEPSRTNFPFPAWLERISPPRVYRVSPSLISMLFCYSFFLFFDDSRVPKVKRTDCCLKKCSWLMIAFTTWHIRWRQTRKKVFLCLIRPNFVVAKVELIFL